MKKIIRTVAVTSFASIIASQTIACVDNSKYNSFINLVNNSKTNHTAIFGFLGSKDIDPSSSMENFFSAIQLDHRWSEWKNDILRTKPKGIKDIQLASYQGDFHYENKLDIDSFWNDKNIEWQRKIFAWIYNGTKQDSYKTNIVLPQNTTGIEKFTTKKDKNNHEMPTKLPVFFFIKNGELLVAGQGWYPDAIAVETQFNGLKTFITQMLSQ